MSILLFLLLAAGLFGLCGICIPAAVCGMQLAPAWAARMPLPPPPPRIVMTNWGFGTRLAGFALALGLTVFTVPAAFAQAVECVPPEFPHNGECVTCFPDRHRDGECRAPPEKCPGSSTADGCVVPIYDAEAGESHGNICPFTAAEHLLQYPKCADIFGPTFEFPAPAGGNPLGTVYNCDPNGERGLTPATANTEGQTSCECADPAAAHLGGNFFRNETTGGVFVRRTGGFCLSPTADLGDYAEEDLCEGFAGDLQTAAGTAGTGGTGEAAKRVCSGVDGADTFCIVDAADLGNAFACRGLLKHVRRCNLDFHRPALNPFLCGPRCDEATEAPRGGKCCVKARLELDGECVAAGE